MAQRNPKQARYEDLLALPDNMVGEILDGELFASPRPSVAHGQTTTRLAIDLGGSFEGPGDGRPGGWHFVFEPELHLRADVVVPDLAGWRRERVAELPRTAALEIPPDWLCETLSPATAKIDHTRKLPIYAREGVPHVWMVDLSGFIEVFRLAGKHYTLLVAHEVTAGVKVRLEPFESVELDVARWFATT